ncbi:tachylectin-2-like [Bombina bombina]|uniref:tachylectin-2-like n=1 Tax=Bombina bombina TaxID=8345 RepID=UPI00235A5E15|nr:tachylectin-2-like [Bombina bombina]
MSNSDTVLFTVDKNGFAKCGLPPVDYNDSYDIRADHVGRLANASHISFSPDGQLYAVRGYELYTGPMPHHEDQDWFAEATRVGKANWDKIKYFFFHPKGDLYVLTTDGKLYKGPAPNNEDVSWMYGQATKIGNYNWDKLNAVFFDPEGILYAVTSGDSLVMGKPPTNPAEEWERNATTIGTGGWLPLTYFISFSSDGYLWCVRKDGQIFRGPRPTVQDSHYIDKATCMGYDYDMYRFLSFTRDRTVQSIISFEFLPDEGKTVSESLEILESQNFVNTQSSSPLQCTFSFTKTIKNTSVFTHEHGFTFGVKAELTFKAGIPFIAESELKIGIDFSTSHKWTFSETNETTETYSMSNTFNLQPGKAVRQVASIKRAQMHVPYRAKVRTMFGNEITMSGVWQGASTFNLMVKQEDI